MSSGNKPKTKITIKPFRHQVQMDPNYAENTWSLLRNAIHEIHKKNASGLSFEELYRNAYNMVLHKYGDRLYSGLRDVVHQHLREVADQVTSVHDDQFLDAINTAWSEHKVSMLMIRDILMYMDRVYVVHNSVASVYDLGLQLFSENIARNPKIKDRLLKLVLDSIKRERGGEVIPRSQLKSVTQMLVDLGISSRAVYEEDFEKPFLETSASFYRVESLQFIAENSCSDYMRKVEIRLKEEVERVQHYMDPATEPKIREVAERELISNHMKSLVEMEGSGEVSMLKDDKLDDLNRMFNLLGRVPKGHELMRNVMSALVKETGKAIVEAPENQSKDKSYVQTLLDLKDKYDKILNIAFVNEKQFQHCLNQAFEFFINLNQRSPEFISLFIDEKLRKGLKGATEEDIEKALDKVMTLFRFIQEKDVFEKYYQQHLAKRLLLNRSVSDAERSMIQKLKTECGYQFTSKLEGMFTDMKLSADTMDNFKAYVQDLEPGSLGGVDLSVHVLTTGYWPTQPNAKSVLPQEVQRACEVFTKFYLNNHSGRRLAWQTNMGTAELRAQFGPKKHELTVSTYQMAILLLFNQTSSMSFKDMLEHTGVTVVDLKRNLATLTSAKYKLLLIKGAAAAAKKKKDDDEEKEDGEGAGAGAVEKAAPTPITEDSVFLFNDKFRSKLYRVKILQVVQKETEPEREGTQKKIDEDRKHMIEAAIVRVMKARKSMEHSALIAEVTKQLAGRFRPNPVMIKKRIESLIERDYLERSAQSQKTYNYLA
eukprot:TRINITY_DN1322_c0_g1_i3.p1 TRINITY_DN1322_c0_g1~~TRINITY_DN1322_c0_g1_i3.p1  ORF type:complete len:767 (-),score=234.76 TRINITY_DN1322_c0_g1_i3:63-2363(-)